MRGRDHRVAFQWEATLRVMLNLYFETTKPPTAGDFVAFFLSNSLTKGLSKAPNIAFEPFDRRFPMH